MVYTGFVDGYLIEWTPDQGGTYGTSTIVAAGTQTYLWGAIGQEAVHPSPTMEMIYRATGVNTQEVEAGALWKGKEVLIGAYGMVMQNAIPIWAVMGGHTDTDAAGIYTHTIVPAATTGGAIELLPSFSIQHELAGDSTNWQVQFTGVKCQALSMLISWETKVLMASMDWIAKKATKGTFESTNAPVLPPTATETPYHMSNMTRTWDYGDANTALDGLVEWEFSIDPDLDALYAATWDGATYTGRNLNQILEGVRKNYNLRMVYHPESSAIWEELVSGSNTEDMYFKFTKSTNDYIELTLTDCWVLKHELKTPTIGEPLLAEVIIEPRQVSFTVKDTINGNPYYGDNA
jgi:hypothetical protein